VQNMGRVLPDVASVPTLLLSNLDHPEWKDVGARCLSCTSCTLACPTCFCWDVEDATDLSGNATQRTRVWDSCFNPGFSSVAGGNIRPNATVRYRQWLTHKMGSWVQQFGVSGCVGCGRCITWCPAGIDITEEIKAIRVEAKE
jgi:sulfhydrogenase subunit beta (sulfur reductase)